MLSFFTKKNIMVFENQNSNEEHSKRSRQESEQSTERIDENSNKVRTNQQEDGGFDEVDGKSTKEQLGNVAHNCNTFAAQLQIERKAYSKKNFKSISSKIVLRKTYKSPLEFEVFDEPANVDPETDPHYLLAMKRIIYDVLQNIFFEISDPTIEDIRARLINTLEPLEGVIPRLVDESSYHWKPKTQTMADLEREVNLLPNKDWPIFKQAGLTKTEKRQKLINLTLIKHLEHLMTSLGNAARVLHNKY